LGVEGMGRSDRPTAFVPTTDALRHGLQNLGYSEGRNITLDVRYTQGRSDLAAQFAAELVRSDVAVIVAHFTRMA
jgi:putative tryptophan/tyrosine transport system substrate-binding protein